MQRVCKRALVYRSAGNGNTDAGTGDRFVFAAIGSLICFRIVITSRNDNDDAFRNYYYNDDSELLTKLHRHNLDIR
jgi:hypothetical protein